MTTVKQLKEKIVYHQEELNGLIALINTAQKICQHNYIHDAKSMSQYKQICEYCEKTRWL